MIKIVHERSLTFFLFPLVFSEPPNPAKMVKIIHESMQESYKQAKQLIAYNCIFWALETLCSITKCI